MKTKRERSWWLVCAGVALMLAAFGGNSAPGAERRGGDDMAGRDITPLRGGLNHRDSAPPVQEPAHAVRASLPGQV